MTIVVRLTGDARDPTVTYLSSFAPADATQFD
jgi:hypothetical protein